MSESDVEFVERTSREVYPGFDGWRTVSMMDHSLDRLFGLARRGAASADRIEQLEAALLTGVCMLSEMGLDPREKCQMAYDYMSAALGNVHSIGHEDGLRPRERA